MSVLIVTAGGGPPYLGFERTDGVLTVRAFVREPNRLFLDGQPVSDATFHICGPGAEAFWQVL